MKDAKGHGSNPRDAAHQTGVNNVGSFLYHATLTPHMDSIVKSGIKPSPENANFGVGATLSPKQANTVYLSDSPNSAQRFGDMAANTYGELFGSKPRVVLLRAGKQNVVGLSPDILSGDYRAQHVRPEHVEAQVKGQWKPLKETKPEDFT